MSVEDFIAKVKSRPELWQTTHPLYKHRFVASKIWTEISEELGINVLTLRKKWKHLKDQFRKEHKRVLSKTIETSYWHNYERLYFLSEDFQNQLAEGTVDISEQTAETTDESDNDIISNSDSDERPLKAKRPKKISPNKLKPASLACINNLGTKSADAGKLNFILSKLNAMESAIENRKTLPEDTRTNDSDYMFILSLLPLMKKLSEIQKLQLRGKMNDWLLEIVTQNEYSNSEEYKVILQNQIANEILPDD